MWSFDLPRDYKGLPRRRTMITEGSGADCQSEFELGGENRCKINFDNECNLLVTYVNKLFVD